MADCTSRTITRDHRDHHKKLSTKIHSLQLVDCSLTRRTEVRDTASSCATMPRLAHNSNYNRLKLNRHLPS